MKFFELERKEFSASSCLPRRRRKARANRKKTGSFPTTTSYKRWLCLDHRPLLLHSANWRNFEGKYIKSDYVNSAANIRQEGKLGLIPN